MKYYLPEMPLLDETILPIEDDDLKNFQPIPPKADNKIAIIMAHFLRDKLLLITLKSIFLFHPGCKIYIAEQGVYNSNSEKLYQLLVKNGHQIIYAGYDAGIARCRNLLVKATTEPYIYWQDDDDCFLPTTDLYRAVKILEKNPQIGAVGLLVYLNDKIEHYEMFLNIENRQVSYTPAWRDPKNKNKPFIYCDMTLNNVVARREIFDDVMWDERLKLTEHLDFFLQLKHKTKWKVVYTNIYIKNQSITVDNPNYKLFRGRNKYFWQYYIKKWNIDYVHNPQLSSTFYKLQICSAPIINPKKNIINPKSVETIKEQKIISPENKKSIVEIFKLIKSENINFWLLKNSCFEVVIHNELKTNKLQIGVETENDKNRIITLLTKYNITIEIDVESKRKTKIWNLEDVILNVPCPVVIYLEYYTKKSWKEIMKNIKNE